MKRALLISGVAALALSVTAFGVVARGMDGMQGTGGARASFEELDANSDGKVTPDEMQAHRAARFAAADTDGNGMLSAEEMTAAAQARMAERMALRTAKMIEKMDANGDGQLAPDEMGPKDGGAKMLSRLDADKDGAISAEEFAQLRAGRKGNHDGYHKGERMGHERGHGECGHEGGRGMKTPEK